MQRVNTEAKTQIPAGICVFASVLTLCMLGNFACYFKKKYSQKKKEKKKLLPAAVVTVTAGLFCFFVICGFFF